MIEQKINRSLLGSEAILEQCANSPNACVKSDIEGAYRVVYRPSSQECDMHAGCYLALWHFRNPEYQTRPLGIQISGNEEFPFWLN